MAKVTLVLSSERIAAARIADVRAQTAFDITWNALYEFFESWTDECRLRGIPARLTPRRFLNRYLDACHTWAIAPAHYDCITFARALGPSAFQSAVDADVAASGGWVEVLARNALVRWLAADSSRDAGADYISGLVAELRLASSPLAGGSPGARPGFAVIYRTRPEISASDPWTALIAASSRSGSRAPPTHPPSVRSTELISGTQSRESAPGQTKRVAWKDRPRRRHPPVSSALVTLAETHYRTLGKKGAEDDRDAPELPAFDDEALFDMALGAEAPDPLLSDPETDFYRDLGVDDLFGGTPYDESLEA